MYHVLDIIVPLVISISFFFLGISFSTYHPKKYLIISCFETQPNINAVAKPSPFQHSFSDPHPLEHLELCTTSICFCACLPHKEV